MAKKTKKYVDGYVLVVKKSKLKEYIKIADEYAKLWMKHGALAVRECRGDDLEPDMEDCELLQFSKLMKVSANETVWFSYIEYKSKKDRDRINKAVEKEMSKTFKDNPDAIKNMPFDMKRMAFGGFQVEVDESSEK